jgi:CheY-like chemotaxis protein
MSAGDKRGGQMSKIVLVEDNEDNRDMLSRRLTRKGYEVLIAVNGEEAVDLIQKEQPALVLMDISLPVMDGFEATRRLKSLDATKNIPIVALTAHAMSGDREKAIDAGCDDYDVKPVELTRLLSKIENLLKTRGIK